MLTYCNEGCTGNVDPSDLSFKDSTSQSLASVGELVNEKRSQQFLCSPAYKKEILAIESSCLPSKVTYYRYFVIKKECATYVIRVPVSIFSAFC
jgi:hypothetical protein